ncbi:monovalent cation:proton antiporter-2 (CPA2) family protein [Salinarimonas soli]|uniref:Potassium transporter TrkA n=1 Tax=Salinarimonas soli TaxID=1638099 RepID=A0A5B2W0R0_9HYPH|nr:monovalent cation:proton antiporter-2 (CPA2) family protein [Salinarimonas soli]KAA2244212.1 potassium transporter TrkA [Salinarimonas soli]
MAGTASHASFLPPVLVFCAAAVIAVPIVRRLGQSAVLGYLAAGLAIGPSGLGLVGDPGTILGVAELGVVLLLFIVGLELKVSRLMSMRRDIFGLGLAQMAVTGVAVGLVAQWAGFSPAGAAVVGIAIALSATSITLQILEERHDLHTPYGERSFAVLLFQDLAIAPILAVVPLLGTAGAVGSLPDALTGVSIALGAVLAVVIVGRYGLNPFFRLLADSGAREVLTASALLVVLGAALLMQEAGLSMAMGAFLAGVLLAESNFRHQLEADIEPFRGILLGLFFISVGMTIDLAVVRQEWRTLLLATPVIVAGKALIVAVLMRTFGSPWRDGLRAGAALSPAGEFAFVLLPLAAGYAILSPSQAQLLTALAAFTMLAGPVAAKALDGWLAGRGEPEPEPDSFDGAEGEVVVIGFGRFGQIVNQILLAQGVDVTVIDLNVDRIRNAARFGFRVYYGDGGRLDVLRAAGAGRARMICVCIDDPPGATRIVEMVHQHFPQAATYVRAYDRIHAIDLMNHDADFIVRESFESALAFGQGMLEGLGIERDQARAVVDDVRRRDTVRLMLQRTEGMMGGLDLLHGVTPEPLVEPKAKTRALSPETRDIIGDESI